MKIKELNADILKGEIEKYNGLPDSKKQGCFDRMYINQLENEYGVRFIGVSNKNKLNIMAYRKIEGTGNYTTVSLSLDDRNSKTVLRFANAVINFVYERALLKNSPELSQMEKRIEELQKLQSGKNNTGGQDSQDWRAYVPDYKKKCAEPSLEDMMLTLQTIKTMPDVGVINSQRTHIRNLMKQYMPEYAA